MKKVFITKLLAAILAGTMLLSLTACRGSQEGQKMGQGQQTEQETEKSVQSKNLMEGYSPIDENGYINIIGCEYNPDLVQAQITDFSVRLFQNSSKEGENTLISPTSVLAALAMTANGAKNQTLTQMEEVFGLNVEQLNSYLLYYMQGLPNEEKYKLSMANSIWFTDDERFTVNQDFLKTNGDYYQAGIYRSAFDKSTLDDINRWVEQNTDGMIRNILDEIPEEAVMYLINTLAFEAEWLDTYEENQVREGVFTTEDGTKQKAEMMYSDESLYIEDEQATGFIKYYNGKKYAFAALLPNEGVTVSEYVAGLSGEKVRSLLENPKEIHVNAAIPQFETEYDVIMNDVLIKMGMTDAFSKDNADFTGLGSSTVGNIFIGRVIHKTFITVGPLGTKAGAATVVEVTPESAPFHEEEETVYLDRPFVYMLIDCENNQPFFMGTCMSVEAECGLE